MGLDITTEKSATQLAYEKIATLIATAQVAINKAEKVADKHNIGISLDIAGYGMGGYYSGGSWTSSSDAC